MPFLPPSRALHRVVTLTALTALAAAQPTPAWPGAWPHDRLASATYVILDPQITGNQNVVGPAQREGVLRALRKDSGDALKRRYPGAVIAAGTPPPDAIRVKPMLDAPAALVPWAKLTVSLKLDMPDGAHVALVQQFGLLTLWQQGSAAANYAFDHMARQLP